MRLCVDWDGTLVDSAGEWLPGALPALRRLAREHTVLIHSSRAVWPGGAAQIAAKLKSAKLALEIVAKPHADLYVDNLALSFTGDWPVTLRRIKHAAPQEERNMAQTGQPGGRQGLENNRKHGVIHAKPPTSGNAKSKSPQDSIRRGTPNTNRGA